MFWHFRGIKVGSWWGLHHRRPLLEVPRDGEMHLLTGKLPRGISDLTPLWSCIPPI